MMATKKHHVWTAVLLIILVIVVIFVVVNTYLVYDKDILPITLRVGDVVGLNADPGVLNFGTVMPGTHAERFLVLTPDYDVEVKLVVEGIDIVSPHEHELIIQGGTTRRIIIDAYPLEHHPFGEYSGTLIVLSKRL
jgi:hypothetical protein